jgi:hypothetical protein
MLRPVHVVHSVQIVWLCVSRLWLLLECAALITVEMILVSSTCCYRNPSFKEIYINVIPISFRLSPKLSTKFLCVLSIGLMVCVYVCVCVCVCIPYVFVPQPIATSFPQHIATTFIAQPIAISFILQPIATSVIPQPIANSFILQSIATSVTPQPIANSFFSPSLTHSLFNPSLSPFIPPRNVH